MSESKRICLIDDDKIFQFLTQRIINDTELVHEIEVFSNDQEALHYLESIRSDKNKLPDIIILDLFMPVLDGWGF